MTKTATKRKVNMPAGIRNKLTAAVLMLLISSLMVVSSTYAWFTLSTAPEVTGITTSVGANGNLEMMLLNKDTYTSTADDLGVESKVGDSYAVKDMTKANETWGNLVDLSDNSYGLDKIVLTPSKLNVTKGADNNANTINGTMLKVPSYGTDGRIIEVNTDTYSGRLDNASWIYDDAHAGVRAIGTSSGVTKRLSAYRTAVSLANSNATSSKNAAAGSLVANGNTLAGVLVGHLANENATVTLDQVKALQTLVNALKTSNDNAGTALVQAVLAYNLSEANTNALTDEEVDALVASFDGITPDAIPGTATKQAGVDAAVTQWTDNNTKINAAKNTVDALVAANKASYTYTEIESVINGLINKQFTKISGIQNPTRDDMQAIIDDVLDTGKVNIEMLDGSGIYSDIAKLVGDYTASGFKVTVNYNGLTASPNVTMFTSGNTTGLIPALDKGNAPAATVGGEGVTTTLTDTFGYAIDLGFRTNAASSNLLLQTAAKQRVYETGEDGNTQGYGSYMEFTSANTNLFSVDEIRALMSAIRVAFVSPTDGGYEILGIAAPAITGTTDMATGVTTYTGGEEVGNNGLKADLQLYKYTVGDDGYITLGDKADSETITALTQNKAKKITAIVYLDGNIVDNTMVANAATSMSGKLNLQFASSATLQPMENSGLRDGGSAAKDASAVTYTQVAAAGTSYTFSGAEYTVNADYTVYNGSDGNKYFKKTGDANYTKLTTSNYTTVLTKK